MPDHPEVFINYRTADDPTAAAMIENYLSQRFGSDLIFRDQKSIKLGSPYPAALRAAVRHCGVLLAVIGPRWLDGLDARLVDGQDDWTRIEIAEALEYETHIVPVLAGARTEPLPAHRLPSELRGLALLQYRRVAPATSHHDLRVLGDELAELAPRLGGTDVQTQRTKDGATPARVSNSADNNHGTAYQAGTIGTVFHEAHSPVHSGSGNQYVNSPHQSGAGSVQVNGTNNGGFTVGVPTRPEGNEDR
ncbi:toll/interleukin-1 receptor domain-containing protein [Streptomyces sp. NPDC018019]|uniref:toll/interleukin-1 receptor domain-containing protein n=1 Tax=Streptomyces sp. NPDC018019 TaxID=3365030 RepID=UPI0037B548DE